MSRKPPPTPKTYAQLMAEVATAARTNPPDHPNPHQTAQLPMWPDAVRCVPNAILRSALFGISTNRKYHKTRTVIASVDSFEIRFKGDSFNQTDLDTWEMLLHLARLQPLGTEVKFTAHSLLKQLGRGTGKSQHEELKEQFARLGSGWTEITWMKEQKTFAGTLLSSYCRDDLTGSYVVQFNKNMLELYESGHTLIDWNQRQSLGKNNLAKWLHGHYATHAKPYPYKVQTLRELSGSDVVELRKFRQMLRGSLALLVDVGVLISWSIDADDLVHVVRPPSATQARHLARKPPKKHPLF